MTCAQAFQLFRSCAATMSSRPSTNALHRQSRRAMAMGTRYYSGAKPESATEEAKEGEDKEENKHPEGPSSTPAENEWETKLKGKEEEVTDLKARLQYLQADFLNLQRNAAREKEQQKDFAISRFASDLLETVDVLALALKSVPSSALQSSASEDHPSNSSISSTTTESSGPSIPQKSARDHLVELHHGVEMTHRLLLSTLFKYQIKPFDPTGDVFDPNKMEALYQAPIPGKEPGTVIDCQKSGYMIKDRVLRAAQVGVAQEVQS
ncbi:GrpE-domain-containing protein [Heliocybe sulcata]|uniref:GrpE protein homolog, mitochondrial n=1 Tax=Heliocybe sulcata TaxID=5364 RepID=A0A5C3NAP4_9AGAM|nr:GrpE-domain-containing protein [Heliocybe sulcata]